MELGPGAKSKRSGSFAFGNARQGPASTGRRARNQPPRLGAAEMERALARIAGVNIPTNKRVIIALQYIHGIGPKKAEEICEKVHIPADRRVSQLTRCRGAADPRDDRPRLYGRRRSAPRSGDEYQASDGPGRLSRPSPSQQLPVRGQRTHTNARTRKGKAKAIAGKKK